MDKAFRARASRLGYPAVLQKPGEVTLDVDGTITIGGSVERLAHRIHQMRLEKLRLLAEHYGIEDRPDSGWALAICIAEDWIPGFQPFLQFDKRRRQGRGRTLWTHRDNLRLVSAVDEMMRENPNMTTTAACRAYMKRLPANPRVAGKKVRTVENIYNRAKRELALFDGLETNLELLLLIPERL